MRRLLPRQRATMVIIIAFTVATMGVAFAAPQNSGNPNVTLDILTNDGQNLPSPATVNVAGAGFGSSLSGSIVQCRVVSQFKICSNTLGQFTSTPAGTFTTTVTLASSFTGFNAQNQPVQVSCVPTPTPPCTVEAETNNGLFSSAHTISFSSGGSTTLSTTTSTSTSVVTSTSTSTSTTNTTMGTTTSTTNTTVPTTTSTTVLSACDKARLAKTAFNAQIDANIAAVNSSGLSAAEKAAAVARLNAIRDQGNAQLDAQLANCP